MDFFWLSTFFYIEMNSNKSVGVVGAPLNFGQPKKGVEKGPKVLRDNRLLDIIENLGWNVKDYGDLPLETADPTVEHIESKKAINISEVSWGNQLIKDAVAKSESENQVTLLLGGDHSVAIGYVIQHFCNLHLPFDPGAYLDP